MSDTPIDRRVTFWTLYRQALVVGDYQSWREVCYRAVMQGCAPWKVSAAIDLAFFTNLGVPLCIAFILWQWLS
jgi:hypothetical protein